METCAPDGAIVSRLRAATYAISVWSMAVGGAVLAGWFLDVPRLKDLAPGLATMKANTAFCFLLLGAALWVARRENLRPASRPLAAAVLAVGLTTLTEYAFHRNLFVDNLIAKDVRGDGISAPGRMAPHTAVCFAVLALSLILLQAKGGRRVRAAQSLALIPGIISLAAIFGYLFSVVSFYRIASFTGMALHTAVTLFLVSAGVFFFKPADGLAAPVCSEGLGGTLLRRMWPAAVLALTVIAWIRMEGQKAGLYGTEFGLAAMVTVDIVVFTALLYASGRSIDRMMAERLAAERALEAARHAHLDLYYTFETVIDAAPLPVIALDRDGKVTVWNQAAEKFFGWAGIEALGRANPLVADCRGDEFQTILGVLSQGHAVQGIETVFATRDGEEKTVLLRASPIFGRGGEVSGCVIVATDPARHSQSQLLGRAT